MTPENEITTEVMAVEGGKIIFAPEVIATIASLAAAEIEGIEGMSAGVVEQVTGMLNKKSLTKGVKVEIAEDQATIDVSVIVKYPYRLHEVCFNVQRSIKNAIETMTGLKVAAVNVAVQSISFEKPEAKKEKQEQPPVQE